MRFLDTNIFVRLLAGDDDRKTAACLALFQKIASGAEHAVTSEAVICEVVYVLSSPSLYRRTRGEIAARLEPLLALRGLQLPNKTAHLRALEIYRASRTLDFEDTLSVAHMERLGVAEIVSYDRDFDAVSGVKRVEP